MSDFVREQTVSRLESLDQALEAAANEATADAIHDLRVASRRFVQCLRAFSARLDSKAAGKIRRRVRKLLDRCGAVRNCDIAMELLRDVGLTEQAPAFLELREKRQEAEAALAKQLRRWRKRNISHDWPDRLFAEDTLGGEIVPDLAALTEALFEQGKKAAAPESSHGEMHQFRLLAKRYRYTVEIFRPQYADAAIEVVLAGMRELQDRLGEMNDCVSTLELVEGHTQAEGAVRRLLVEREQAFRSHWKRHFGTRRLKQWTSIFSGTAKRNLVPRPSRKRNARSQKKDATTSAA